MSSEIETLLCLVRHGESAWNLEGRVQGQQDPPLSELGLRQAEAAARALAAEPWHALYASDLARAAQTAAAISRHTRLPIRLDPDLRERGQGTLEGRLLADLTSIPDVDAPEVGREPIPAVLDRCRHVVTRMRSPDPPDGPEPETQTERRVIVVTHGAFIQHALESLGITRESQAAPRNGSLTRLRLGPAGAALITFDDVSHLPDTAPGEVSPFYASLMSSRRRLG